MAKKKPPADERLASYRRKRSAGATPEPFGAGATNRSRFFVVQKHAARNMHFDLRLELGGVLLSWAVPKGPSLDPKEKRLAVEVEPHPVDYGDFEGLIPEGNYGAGAVIVFDHGRWVEVEDAEEGLRQGKLLFDLWGHKLRGRWTLFRTKASEKSWLLMKKPDAWAAPDGELPQESVFSGLTVEELRDGVDRMAPLRARLERLKAPRRTVRVADVEPMLAQTAEAPFTRSGWLFEVKYDGYRLLAARDEEGKPALRYRRGQDVTRLFPEIATAVRGLPCGTLILDGEVVVLDPDGRPSFQRLQQRVHLTRPADIDAAAVSLSATLFVFDLLAFEGYDLRALPLVERKDFLRLLLPPAGELRFSEHFETRGEEVFAEVSSLGLEGIVAKKADSPYRSGRSSSWLKIRADRTGDFAVIGFTAPKGSRSGIGALHVAARQGEGLVYAGRVGTGFTDRDLEQVRERLLPHRIAKPQATGEIPRDAKDVWVEPHLVAEVRYKERTDAGVLRHPVFLRWREDKTVAECEDWSASSPREEPQPVEPPPAPRVVPFTNLDKVFWPEEGYTKGDLIEYYRSVSPWLLPYLRDRPVVLTRYPDGIEGKSFFQKDAPGFVPDWLRTETMWSEHAGREISYFICEDEESLLYLVNLGTIPLHLWSSRMESLQHPDWCILDLDPKEAPFENVVRVARAIHALCGEIGLDCYIKTSGSTGLHVLLPLGGLCTYDQSRQLAQLMAQIVTTELSKISTIARAIGARGGRVYVDFLQNGHGKLLVAPFSVRPLPGAPVSTLLRWSEVRPSLDLRDFTIRTVPPRLRRQRADPWNGLLTAPPDLTEALARLAERLEQTG